MGYATLFLHPTFVLLFDTFAINISHIVQAKRELQTISKALTSSIFVNQFHFPSLCVFLLCKPPLTESRCYSSYTVGNYRFLGNKSHFIEIGTSFSALSFYYDEDAQMLLRYWVIPLPCFSGNFMSLQNSSPHTGDTKSRWRLARCEFFAYKIMIVEHFILRKL